MSEKGSKLIEIGTVSMRLKQFVLNVELNLSDILMGDLHIRNLAFLIILIFIENFSIDNLLFL